MHQRLYHTYGSEIVALFKLKYNNSVLRNVDFPQVIVYN